MAGPEISSPIGVTAWLIACVRINRAWRAVHRGRAVWRKRRRRGMTPVLYCGNLFLMLCETPLRMFPDRRAWARWEVESFVALHGPAYQAEEVDSFEVLFDELPGQGCRDLLAAGRLTAEVLEDCAHEFHRAHALRGPDGTPLSHGDPHLGNMLHDGRTARLIDFEQAHLHGVDVIWRRADDLLVFLLDLLGRCPEADWPRLGAAFARAYPDAAVREALRARLVPPAGFEAILWATRTDHLPRAQMHARLEALAHVL